MVWGAAIGAAASLAAGALAAHQNAQQASASRDYGYQMAGLNYRAQKEFAQNGIRWRVEDAKAAGLHPLAALGASPLGFSPSFGAGGGFSGSSDWSNAANAFGDLGQSIDRAIDAKATEQERADRAEDESTLRKLQIKNAQLQNDKLSQQIIDNGLASAQALRTQAGQPPAMQQVIPIGRDGRTLPGQGDAHTSLFTVKPVEIQASEPTRPAQEAGSVPEVRFGRTADGGYTPMRSQALEEALEDDFLGSAAWNMRNRIIPTAWDSAGSPPPNDFLPKGHDRWAFNPIKQAWYPVRKGDSWDYAKKKFKPW